MSRVREQYGNVDERHVKVDPGLGNAEAHFSPPMREILKRYELCRKNTKGSPSCAAERNQAMAALSGPPAAAEPAAEQGAVEAQPAVKAKPAAKHKQAAAKPAGKPDPAPAEHVDAEAMPVKAEAAAMQTEVQPAPPATKPEAAAPVTAPDRAAREQKIAGDFAACMRAKPKFECESARAAALKALDEPTKPKAKSKSANAVKSPDVATN